MPYYNSGHLIKLKLGQVNNWVKRLFTIASIVLTRPRCGCYLSGSLCIAITIQVGAKTEFLLSTDAKEAFGKLTLSLAIGDGSMYARNYKFGQMQIGDPAWFCWLNAINNRFDCCQ